MVERRSVIVVCDGLRADFLKPEWTPNLCRLMGKGCRFAAHKSVFPSTTRTTSASIATGCYPAGHGLQGNTIALDEGNGLVPLSAGAPDFRDRLRSATGKTLNVPTLAERLEKHGGSIVFSNVSPGAAYFQDPDGYGYVYHRSGSFGPGLIPINSDDALTVTHDAEGDFLMTTRFIEEVLKERKPALSVLWQCEPDHSQHGSALGSPKHLEAIAAADANVGRVANAISALDCNDDEVLLLICSDHGHETIGNIIDLEGALIEAGFKASRNSRECVVASQGLSAFIYLSKEAMSELQAILEWLSSVKGVGEIYTGDELIHLGQSKEGPLAIAIDGAKLDTINEYGVVGESDAFLDRFSTKTIPGVGQHGGLGPNEQNPFLIAIGGGVKPASVHMQPTAAVDLAPTVLRHLEQSFHGMDGVPLPFR